MLSVRTSLQKFALAEELCAALRWVAVLLLVLVFGTLGFWFTEQSNGWDLWKSLFFTLITVTTVGYGDQGLSPTGERFAAILLLFGIGTATYAVTSLVQIAVTYHTGGKRRMQQTIDRMEDHYIICGYGRIGKTVAAELVGAGTSVVVIDRDVQMTDAAIDDGYLAVLGSSTEEEVLCRAGAERARGLICATNSDAENVFVTLCAQDINPDAFIASRASTDGAARRMERAGAAMVVSPYVTAGQNIADAILRPHMASFLKRNRQGDVELGEIAIEEGSAFLGETILGVGSRFPEVVFVSYRKICGTNSLRPVGSQEFHAGDVITVAGPGAELEKMYEWAESGRKLVDA